MPSVANLALGTGSDMLLELIATTSANGSGASVWRARQSSPGAQWAVGWQPLGKPGRGDPRSVSVIQQGPGEHLEAFVVDDEDCAVWHSWQTDPHQGWSAWDLLGNPGGTSAGDTVTLTQLPHNGVMAVVPADGSVWQVSSPQPGPSAFWPAWTSLGQPGGTPTWTASAATLADNRAEVVALQSSNHPGTGFGDFGTLWHRWQVSAGGTQWSRWESLGLPGGKLVGLPTLAQHHDRRLELFATTGDGHVWHRVLRTATDPRSWSPWASLPPTGPQPGVTDLAVARDATGRLVLIGTAGYQVWHTGQTAADADTWTPWSALATVPGPPAADGEELGSLAVGFNHAGLVEIFVVTATTGELHHLQATASGQLTLAPQTFPQP